MKLGLEGKNVLVTGGSKGIGRAIVEEFLAEGAIVHLCARTESDLEIAFGELLKLHDSSKIKTYQVDVARSSDITSWIETIAGTCPIDIVVSNVSALSIPDTPESWDLTYNTDIKALHTIANASLPHLEKSKGNLISIASVSGRDVDATAPGPYGAAKAAVIHYTGQLARRWASKGVRVNSVSPGNIYIEQGFWGNMKRANPEVFESQVAKNPYGRMGKAEEVADAVVWLASERATFVSGSNIVVDGALCNGVQF